MCMDKIIRNNVGVDEKYYKNANYKDDDNNNNDIILTMLAIMTKDN